MSRDHSQHILQFYEERSLRNLVFLYLPIQDAPQSVVMFHINLSIEKFQQQNRSYSEQIVRLENALDHRDQEISKLEGISAKHVEVIYFECNSGAELIFGFFLFSQTAHH